MRRGMIFKARWGWMGIAESETGLVAIVLPQNSKAAVAADLRAPMPLHPSKKVRLLGYGKRAHNSVSIWRGCAQHLIFPSISRQERAFNAVCGSSCDRSRMAGSCRIRDWPAGLGVDSTQGRSVVRSVPTPCRSSCPVIGLWRMMHRSADFLVAFLRNGSCLNWKGHSPSFVAQGGIDEGGDSKGHTRLR